MQYAYDVAQSLDSLVTTEPTIVSESEVIEVKEFRSIKTNSATLIIDLNNFLVKPGSETLPSSRHPDCTLGG
jgi:hypothetical protein